MQSVLIDPTVPRKWVLVCEIDDDPVSALELLARQHGVDGAHFTGIGAFSEALLAYFEWPARTYRDIPVPGQVEVVSLAVDIARAEHGPRVHAHAVVARGDGTAFGGHLRSAHVRPTLELVLEETPGQLVRVHDPHTGLALIDLSRWAARESTQGAPTPDWQL